jgi:hypothetical protein
MPINLKDIPDAVQSYLNSQVSVTIAQLAPATGTTINPGETFDVRVEATNATAVAGGIALTNVKFRISVDNGAIAKLIVPAGAIYLTTDLAGNRLNANQEVTAMIVENQIDRQLSVGDTKTLVVTGKATGTASGGNTTVRARVLADIDLDALFPQGEDTGAATRALVVVG